jgi:hypothetical protein
MNNEAWRSHNRRSRVEDAVFGGRGARVVIGRGGIPVSHLGSGGKTFSIFEGENFGN